MGLHCAWYSGPMPWSPLAAWTNLRNAADWRLRGLLRWSPSARERAEAKEPATETEAHWERAYGLGPAQEKMTTWRWKRNLAVIEILDRLPLALADGLRGLREPRILDIGSKNFDYVDALHGFFSSFGAPARVTGLEIDAHRRYTDLRTRRAWAEHYCSTVPGARYLAQGLEDHHDPYEVITWFFPFVTEHPLVRWGLPRSLFRPQTLVDHALGLLVPGGWMVIVNLNAREAEVQHSLLVGRDVEVFDLGVVAGSYSPGARDQRMTLVHKA